MSSSSCSSSCPVSLLFLLLILHLLIPSRIATTWYFNPSPGWGGAEFKSVENRVCALEGVDMEYEMFEHPCGDDDLARIYCRGKIIEAANFHWLAILFKNDSKHFVDRPLKKEAKLILKEFEEIFGDPKKLNVREMDVEKLKVFMRENFGKADGVLLPSKLDDWLPDPPKLKNIKNQKLKEWAKALHDIWKDLGRKMPEELGKTNSHSYIYVPYPFVIPGGRFREFYYWDTYWIVRGLIASGMLTTVKHMCLNFAHMVKRFGFVPNGGRIYYNKRSQPPFLALMVNDYYKEAKDQNDNEAKKFLKENLPILEQELNFWRHNRSVRVEVPGGTGVHIFYQYRAETNVPRPESFCADVDEANAIGDPRMKAHYWRQVGSAAESGWDFSSRWMKERDGEWELPTLQTTNVVPVDLNALICANLRILADLYGKIEDKGKADKYQKEYEQFREEFQQVFYDEKDGAWFDYHLKEGQLNKHFYGSNAMPLFVECYHEKSQNGEQFARRMFEWMEGLKEPKTALGNNFGVPVSAIPTKQQWDYPNIWPPIAHLIMEGLRKSGDKKMQEEALKMAKKWVAGNYLMYHECEEHMFEKMEAETGTPGGGGEYQVQLGFGWTNGAVLDLLVTYGEQMELLENLPEVKCEKKKEGLFDFEPEEYPPPEKEKSKKSK